jgi:hypothetical protein
MHACQTTLHDVAIYLAAICWQSDEQMEQDVFRTDELHE